MEAEKRAEEEEEKRKQALEKKVQEEFSFGDAKNQWEKDKEAATSMAKDKEGQDIDSAEQPRKSGKPRKPAREVEESPQSPRVKDT